MKQILIKRHDAETLTLEVDGEVRAVFHYLHKSQHEMFMLHCPNASMCEIGVREGNVFYCHDHGTQAYHQAMALRQYRNEKLSFNVH